MERGQGKSLQCIIDNSSSLLEIFSLERENHQDLFTSEQNSLNIYILLLFLVRAVFAVRLAVRLREMLKPGVFRTSGARFFNQDRKQRDVKSIEFVGSTRQTQMASAMLGECFAANGNGVVYREFSCLYPMLGKAYAQ